jgi:hypothetical protein
MCCAALCRHQLDVQLFALCPACLLACMVAPLVASQLFFFEVRPKCLLLLFCMMPVDSTCVCSAAGGGGDGAGCWSLQEAGLR